MRILLRVLDLNEQAEIESSLMVCVFVFFPFFVATGFPGE